MCNALTAQVWSFRHPDVPVDPATSGAANLALNDQPMWDGYKLAALAGDRFKSDAPIAETPAGAADPADFPSTRAAPSRRPTARSPRRCGAASMSCHDAIWEQAGQRVEDGVVPDHLGRDGTAEEPTNQLVPGTVGTLPESQQTGFHRAR